MRKLLSLLLILCLIPLAGCTNAQKNDTDKLQIVATLFPQYDFARIIGGDKVDVTILLPPGTDSHHFDPSPSDMVKISKSDLFIYTGDYMEPWAGDIASAVGESVNIINAALGISLSSFDGHHDEHLHNLDPHVWLDLGNAKTMCDNIFTALSQASPENKDYFENNLLAYKKELDKLDEEYKNTFSSSQKELVFGGKFALGYLFKRYNIPYISAYDSCSAKSEPAISDIVQLSEFIKENNVKVVFCEEYSEPKVARELASVNNCEVLVIHSCHNLDRADFESGETFISLMTKNLENLRKGLL